MANKQLKIAMLKNEIRQWQVARRLGMTEFSLSRKLRQELPEPERERLMEIIEELGKERRSSNE